MLKVGKTSRGSYVFLDEVYFSDEGAFYYRLNENKVAIRVNLPLRKV